jgi:pimeloyl-ACP methyl ester carboxylesterase
VFDALTAGPADGELVVLLHGFPQTAVCWTEVAATLAAAGYRVLAPDQRGYSPGARPAAVRAHRMPELVADVLALATEAGAGGAATEAGAARFHLVGHDWGGAVAWALAGRHPERVATLTSVSTPHPRAFGAALLTGGQLLRSAYIGWFRIPRVPELMLGPMGARRLRFLLARGGLAPAWADRYASALAEPGALAAALAWYRAASPVDMGVPPVPVPTRYVWGRATRRWDGGRRPPAGAGSPGPIASTSWKGPATGCPRTIPRPWPTCSSSTWRSPAPASRPPPGRGGRWRTTGAGGSARGTAGAGPLAGRPSW